MGWRNKEYHINLSEALYRKLVAMFVPKNKKKQYKMTRAYKEHGFEGVIFSSNTYHTYRQHIKDFAAWMKINYPEVTTIKAAKRHVREYIELREKELKSPHSAKTMASSLFKVFSIDPNSDEYVLTAKRERENYTRSRGTKKSDKNFSRANHEELINFADGTGLRYGGLSKLKGKDLYNLSQLKELLEKNKKEHTPEARTEVRIIEKALIIANDLPEVQYFVRTKEKGGKLRYAAIVGPHVADIVNRCKNTKPDQKVWLYVPKNADVHGERHKYAGYLYKRVARNIEDIPYDAINKGTGKRYQSEVYHCRKIKKGLKLDAHALYIVSLSVGHNRNEVVVGYLESI